MIKDDLMNKYGPTMTVTDLAELFHVTKGCIYNKIYSDRIEFPVFKIGSKMVAETNDVAEYLSQSKMAAQYG